MHLLLDFLPKRVTSVLLLDLALQRCQCLFHLGRGIGLNKVELIAQLQREGVRLTTERYKLLLCLWKFCFRGLAQRFQSSPDL